MIIIKSKGDDLEKENERDNNLYEQNKVMNLKVNVEVLL